MDFSIKAFFGGDVTNLKAATDEAQGILGTFADKAKGLMGDVGASFLGAFSVFGIAQKIIGSIGEIQTQIKELRNLSQEYETSTSVIQAWQAVVVKTGGSVEDANKAFARTRLSVDQLLDGSEKMTKAFDSLGLSAKDFVGLPIPQALEKIAKGYEENRDKAGAYAGLAEIMGSRTLPQLNNALEYLASNGVAKMTEEQTKLNRVWNEDSLTALKNFASGAKGFYYSIETAAVDFAGKVVAAPKLIANSMGVLAGTIANMVTGVKSDAEIMVNVVLDGIEKVNTARSNAGKIEDYNREQARKAAAEAANKYEEQLHFLSETTKGREKINAMIMERNQLAEDTNSALFSQKEIEEKIKAIKTLEIAIAREQKEVAEQLTKEAKKQAEFESERKLNAEIAYQKTKLDELPLKEQLVELEKRRGLMMLNMSNMDQKSVAYQEEYAILGKLNAEIKKVTLEISKAETDELEKQKKKLEEQIELERRKKNMAMNGSLLGVAGGDQFGNVSTPILEEMYRRNQAQIEAMRQADFLNPFRNPLDISGPNASSGALAIKLAEQSNIEGSLAMRSKVLGAYNRGGYTEALQAYTGNPAQFDSFLAIVTKTQTAADKQSVTLDRINTLLTNAFTRSGP